MAELGDKLHAEMEHDLALQKVPNERPAEIGFGSMIPMVSKDGKMRSFATLSPQAIKRLIWDRFGGEELLHYTAAKREAQATIALDAANVTVSAVNVAKGDKGGLTESLIEASGLAIPFAASAFAGAKLAKEAANLLGKLGDQKAFAEFDQQHGTGGTFLNAGLAGLQKLTTRQTRYSAVMMGTYSFDVVSGIVDFTRLSSLISGSTRGLMRLGAYTVTKWRTHQMNKGLSNFKEFNMNDYANNPILGCYLVQNMPAGELMGVFDAFYVEDLEKGEKERIIERLDPSERRAIAVFEQTVLPLRAIATSRIRENAYCLKSEWDRRKSLSFGRAAIALVPEAIRDRTPESVKAALLKFEQKQIEQTAAENAYWAHQNAKLQQDDDTEKARRGLLFETHEPARLTEEQHAKQAKLERKYKSLKEARDKARRSANRVYAPEYGDDKAMDKIDAKRTAADAKVLETKKKYDAFKAKYLAMLQKYQKSAGYWGERDAAEEAAAPKTPAKTSDKARAGQSSKGSKT